MAWVAGVTDDPPGFPRAPPGVDVLEGGKLTSYSVSGSLHNPLQRFAIAAGAVSILGSDAAGTAKKTFFFNELLNQFCSNCFVLNGFVKNCDSFWNHTSDLIVFVMSHSFSRFVRKMLTHSETKHHCCFAWNHMFPCYSSNLLKNSSRCH